MDLHSLPSNITTLLESANVQNVFISVAALALIYILFTFQLDEKPIPGFPVVNKEKGEILNTKAKYRYDSNGFDIITEHVKKVRTNDAFCKRSSDPL